MTRIFDGVSFARQRLEALKVKKAGILVPQKLVSVVDKHDRMGQVYTRLKRQVAQEVGIAFEKVDVEFDDSNHRTISLIEETCKRSDVTGLLIQKPRGITPQVWHVLTQAVHPAKDVDCLTRVNLDKLYSGESDFMPATAKAVMSIMESVVGSTHSLKQKHVVVVGRSELVGKPLIAYLQKLGARVKSLGSRDEIKQNTLTADVLISATGKTSLITSDMVKEGVVVIDVGEPKGDVDFVTVSPKASFITPVPGGVGPVTVVSLLENLLDLARDIIPVVIKNSHIERVS